MRSKNFELIKALNKGIKQHSLKPADVLLLGQFDILSEKSHNLRITTNELVKHLKQTIHSSLLPIEIDKMSDSIEKLINADLIKFCWLTNPANENPFSDSKFDLDAMFEVTLMHKEEKVEFPESDIQLWN